MRTKWRRSRGVVLLATLLILTTAALGTTSPAIGAADPTSLTGPAAVLAGLPGDAPMPTAAGVARALAIPLADQGLGTTPHVEVVDVNTGRVLLDRLGRVPATPASTMKLLTAAAALLVLGPRTRLTTRVLAAGSDLYLVGGGDPTLSTAPALVGAYPASADLHQLAKATAAGLASRATTGRQRVIGRVIGVGGQYAGPDEAAGWSPGYLAEGDVARVRSLVVDEAKLTPGLAPGPRDPDPVLAATQSFRSALNATGLQTGPVTVGTVAPASAVVVAKVSSPPVSALIERMLNYSDADIAEGLGRQIALRSGLPPTFAGTATALSRVARTLHLPAYAQINDASGLSRTNAISPATLTALLREAAVGLSATRPELRALIPALPVAGFSGTLAGRFTVDAPAGAGRVRAKTGWLNGTSALAGVVTTADGRLLAFAALAPAPVRAEGEAALDRLAAALAACGCR